MSEVDSRDARVTQFRVERTSRDHVSVAPCSEAYPGTYVAHVYCSLPLAEAMKSKRTDWFRELANHRPAPGGSVADRPDTPCWFVDLSSLDDLETFVRSHGRVIVDWSSDGPSIEIYDGYRE